MASADPYPTDVVAYCWNCADSSCQSLSRFIDGDVLTCGTCGETTSGDQSVAEAIDRASGDYRYFIP